MLMLLEEVFVSLQELLSFCFINIVLFTTLKQLS